MKSSIKWRCRAIISWYSCIFKHHIEIITPAPTVYGRAGCTFSTTYGVDVPLDDVSGSGSGSCLFLQGLLRRQQKTSAFYAFCLSTVGTFTSVFTDNKLSRSYNTVETKFFLDFFLLFDGRIRIRRSQHLEVSGKPFHGCIICLTGWRGTIILFM
jgi:hypothetical protein